MADPVEEQEVILLPEHTSEEYDEVIYKEDDPKILTERPETVSEFLWRTINHHLKFPGDNHGDMYASSGMRATQLCYARGRLGSTWSYGPVYHNAQRHIFSLDTKRDGQDHFDDCGDWDEKQGARFMYGYLAYLVALDEGL